MSKTTIISDAEIKVLLGISGTSRDALVKTWNTIATEMLCAFLLVDDLGKRVITEERVKVWDPEFLQMKQFPVNISEGITLKDIDFQSVEGPTSWFADPLSFRCVRGKDSDGTRFFLRECELLVTYSAGYTVLDTIELTENPSDGENVIIEIAGVETTKTFKDTASGSDEVAIGATATETATSLATSISGTSTDELVTAPLGTHFVSTTATATITNATIPSALKTSIAFIVGGGIVAKDKVGGVSSYTIGQKTVNFQDVSEKNFVSATIKKFARGYKKANILS